MSRWILLLTLSSWIAPTEPAPAGVIVVLLDDLGPPEVAEAPTPNLDQLASIGRTYPIAWGAPSCSNARAQLISSRYPFREENRVGTNVRDNGSYRLPTSPLLIPALVTASGRSATMLGKWHLAPKGDLDHPLECGFSHAAGTQANLQWDGGDYFNWTKVVDGSAEPRSGYITSDTIDDAVAEVNKGTDFILVNLHASHSPRHCPPPELAPETVCQDEPSKKIAMLEAADTEIGRLASVALPAGYVMILSADNGARKGNEGGKWSVYESGLHVPAIVVGGGVAPGESAALVGVIDFGPTALDLLGVEYEADWFDGVSFAADLTGLQDGALPPRYLYAEIFNTGTPDGLFLQTAIRDERWKLHTGYGYPPEEFYDLSNDPDEKKNLFEGTLTFEQEAALQKLRDHLPKRAG